MEIWQITLTAYCIVNMVFNCILLVVRRLESKARMELGKDICKSSELIDTIADLEHENRQLKLELAIHETHDE